MPQSEQIIVRIKAEDKLSPVLRHLEAELWIMQHPRLSLLFGLSGWFGFGLVLGFVLGLLGLHV